MRFLRFAIFVADQSTFLFFSIGLDAVANFDQVVFVVRFTVEWVRLTHCKDAVMDSAALYTEETYQIRKYFHQG